VFLLREKNVHSWRMARTLSTVWTEKNRCPVQLLFVGVSRSEGGAGHLLGPVQDCGTLAWMAAEGNGADSSAAPLAIYIKEDGLIGHLGWIGTDARLDAFVEACPCSKLRRWWLAVAGEAPYNVVEGPQGVWDT
jgi:hypothetical protein